MCDTTMCENILNYESQTWMSDDDNIYVVKMDQTTRLIAYRNVRQHQRYIYSTRKFRSYSKRDDSQNMRCYRVLPVYNIIRCYERLE